MLPRMLWFSQSQRRRWDLYGLSELVLSGAAKLFQFAHFLSFSPLVLLIHIVGQDRVQGDNLGADVHQEI